MELHDILLKWLQTFELKSAHDLIEDLSDGVALSEALNQIAPEWFTDERLTAKIKTDTIGNWRIKVSNLKKILEKVVDYYQEAFNQNLSGFRKPDLVKIGECSDPVETGRLLQLILGCAVNCNNKQEYIKRIMAMDETEQRAMMECIQELDGGGALSFSASLNLEPQLEQLITQLNAANLARDQMSQRVMELDLQVTVLQEEKNSIVEEKRKLLLQMESSIGAGSGTLRRQVESLKEELFKIESSRDDYRLKVEVLEKEMSEMRLKIDELSKAAAEARSLKDEVDILRETADRVDKYEATLQSYKKKLEESSDARRELKVLEAKNLAYYKHSIELEEEVKRLAVWKTQVEVYKKEKNELREKLDEETRRADKFQYEATTASDKLEALRREKDRLASERDSLKEANEELKCLQVQSSNEMVEGLDPEGLVSDTELRQRLVRLQHENRVIKTTLERSSKKRAESSEVSDESVGVLQSLLADTKEQLEKARKDNREANQRIIKLEGELKEVTEKSVESVAKAQVMELQQLLCSEKQRASSDLEEKELLLIEKNREVLALQERLAQRENEIQEQEDKRKKYVEKAKSVVKAMDPNCLNDMSLMKSQVADPQGEVEKFKLGLEQRQKVMATVFHRMAATKHRESVDQRLSLIGNSKAFLSSQRNPTTKKFTPFNSK